TDKDSNVLAYETGGKHRQFIVSAIRGLMCDKHVLSGDIACFREAVLEGSDQMPFRCDAATAQKSDHQHGRWLRMRRERPRRCSPTQRDKLASLHHSITSSAIASRPEGMTRSKALAVCRLMTNSNLAACSTGRFFSPLRTRPT